jgi:peptide/nickel transport system permease protein
MSTTDSSLADAGTVVVDRAALRALALERADEERRTRRKERRQLLLRKPSFLIGSAILLFWFACALFPSLIAPQDPAAQDLLNKLKEPSRSHWWGTDVLGRDVFSRVIQGTRTIVFVALGATIIATLFGTALGLAAGYFKGRIDDVIMRTADIFSAIPTIVLALLITSTVESRSMVIVMLIIALVFSPIVARTVRSSVLGEAELDYVAAARLRTEKTPHILMAEVFPNILPALAVEFTVRLGYAIFAMATLSFLGAGAGPESPDWGTQVATHFKFLNGLNWSATTFPALAIASLSLAVNMVQDALTEVFER